MATQLKPPANDAAMSDDELVSMLRNEERSAISWRDTALADDQANAIDYYEAEPFGDEEEGRSQVVIPIVAEVVDYAQISILRTMAAGDHVVEFEPGDTDQIPDLPDPPKKPPQMQQQDGQEPDPQAQAAMMQYQQAKAQWDMAMQPFRDWEDKRARAAEDATEAVNYQFMRRQPGWDILLSFAQSGLVEKIGILKTACVTERKKVKQTLHIPEEGLALLKQEGIEVVEADDNGDGTFTVVISQVQETKKYVDYPIPSEEYLFAARTRNADEAEYQAHRCRKTLSDLIEMGFDREIVEGLPTEDSIVDLDQRAVERWDDEVYDQIQRPLAMRKVWLLEEYVRADRDGDGIAELLKVFRVNDVILEIDEIGEPPFVTWSPFPRAHRMVGNGMADKAMMSQRVESVLLRQALDGTYQTNSPRMGMNIEGMTEDTLDDLLVVRPGAIVRYRGVGNKPEPLNEPFDIQKSLGMMEFMQGRRETWTGITRLNQGLDEDTINSTASGQAALQATGQQIEEFIARNFAEALARLFSKKLRLMIEHGNPIALKVDGAYRRLDPSSWDSNMNVAVRVGLGSGRKEMRLMYRAQLANYQQQGLSYGLTNPKKLYNNMAAMVRDSNLGTPSDYWVDPDSDEFTPPQPQQDPAMAKAQADMQIAQQKAQFDQQSAQQQMQIEAQTSQAKLQNEQQLGAAKIAGEQEHGALRLQIEQEKHQAAAVLAQNKAEQEATLAQQKAEFEANLAQQTADRNFELARQQAERDHALARERAAGDHVVALEKAKSVKQDRPGGNLAK